MDAKAMARTHSRRNRLGWEEARIELLRKSIHLLIALVPSLAAWFGRWPTMALLGLGTLVYTLCEILRRAGIEVPLISRITSLAARKRDTGKFVRGPITLGLGAMLSLAIFPPGAASIAIYTLAFGDGLSSLVGKFFGRVKLPLTGGKSLEGSLTCFTAAFLSALLVGGKPLPALAVAAVATLTEAIPLKDFDNIVLPLVTGALAFLVI